MVIVVVAATGAATWSMFSLATPPRPPNPTASPFLKKNPQPQWLCCSYWLPHARVVAAAPTARVVVDAAPSLAACQYCEEKKVRDVH